MKSSSAQPGTAATRMRPGSVRAEPEGNTMSTPRTVRLYPNDNVVVAVDPIPEGAAAAGVTAKARVMRGHKMAIAPIAKGEPVRKYDQIIGFATAPIAPGEWVHTQNVEMHDFARDYRFAEGAKNDEVLPSELRETFEGYARPGGKTGTRNYIGILTSVNCSASAARFIAREVERSGLLADHPEIDGVVAFVHGTGCGWDGYSGITANPALAGAVDDLVKHGGTAILSETPEIYGAEHLLTRRAVNRAVGEKLVERIKWWEAYCERNGGEMNNNPSPGNKAGGLTTILEKSLGAAAKGGTTTMRAVYEYAEPVKEKGFVFMDTPGYDPVGATGQVAGGANVMCFTTGRGSAFGCKPTPSVKLATNSQVYASMIDDMDINCGDILDGTPVAQKGEEIFKKVLATASGARTKSEDLGYGDAEFVPWQIGAVM